MPQFKVPESDITLISCNSACGAAISAKAAHEFPTESQETEVIKEKINEKNQCIVMLCCVLNMDQNKFIANNKK